MIDRSESEREATEATEAVSPSRLGRARTGQGGWTLMEMMVVTGLITILAAMAAPRYAAIALQMRTSAAASRILADLAFARAMAVRTGVHHYLNVSGGAGISYTVRRAANPPNIDPSTDPVVRTVDLSDKLPGVNFDLNGAGTDPYGNSVQAPTPGAPLVFDPRGLPTAAGTFFLASDDGHTSFAISVNGSGRTRLWRRTATGFE